MVDISERPKIKIWYPNKLEPLRESKHRFNILYGGRGGAKSWAIAQHIVFESYQRPILVLCTRQVQNTIRDSVHKLLSDTIGRMEMESFFDIKRDEIYGRNGSKYIFKGLHHNISEIKSLEGVDICWIEEAQNISRESLDILIPTIRKEDSRFYISFNPDNENDPIYQDFIVNGMHDSWVVKINHDDNSKFPEVLRQQMLWEKEYNYEKYLHIWEGNVKSISDACIFKGKFTIDTFETHDDVDFYFGADWGFSVDPSCLVRCYILDDNLYIDYEAYGVGVELDELPALFDIVPEVRHNKIIGDSSRPDTISHIKNKGFIIKSSKKGKNSIEDGIEFIKKFKKVIIHSRCKNTKYEFENYSYKRDRLTEEILPIIVDKDNHIIDALRYALEDLRRGFKRQQSASKTDPREFLQGTGQMTPKYPFYKG